MSRYGMTAPKAKDAIGGTPEYKTRRYEVVEFPLERLAEAEVMPWDSLCRLADASVCGVTLKTVTGNDRVPDGYAWFRRGGQDEGCLAGRALLYQRGRDVTAELTRTEA